jgi:phage minor structural protein
MIYKVFCDNKLIYTTGVDSDLILINPSVTVEINKSGSFEFTIPPTHPSYDKIQKLVSEISVYSDDELIFCGRPTEVSIDFWNRKKIHCEGELSYLTDSIQRPAEYHNMTVRGYLETLIEIHNGQVGEDKQFQVGRVTVTDTNDSIYRYTNWENTLTSIKEDLVDDLGGYIFVRHEDGKRYIDYIANLPEDDSQTVSFGENLLDFTKDSDLSGIATAIIPLGARLEESPIKALEAYTTIESVNGGVDYVYDKEAVKRCGYIFQVVHWDNVTEPSNLKTKGEKYLKESQWENLTIEAKAIDLHFINGDVNQLKLGYSIKVISKPHGMYARFPISKMTIKLDSVSNNTITFGTTQRVTLESHTASTDGGIIKKIERIPSTTELLDDAKSTATDLINQQTSGYVRLRPNELLVMDDPDPEKAQKIWRFNLNGLGYSKTGYNGQFGLAMTMDGAIVADYITAGTLNGNIIRAGKIEDVLGKNYWNLDTGEFSLQGYPTTTDMNDAISSSTSNLDSELNQKEIFNRLTNNGATQGIYLKDGKIYINGEYIQSGTISANFIKGGVMNSSVFMSTDKNSDENFYRQLEIDRAMIGLFSNSEKLGETLYNESAVPRIRIGNSLENNGYLELYNGNAKNVKQVDSNGKVTYRGECGDNGDLFSNAPNGFTFYHNGAISGGMSRNSDGTGVGIYGPNTKLYTYMVVKNTESGRDEAVIYDTSELQFSLDGNFTGVLATYGTKSAPRLCLIVDQGDTFELGHFTKRTIDSNGRQSGNTNYNNNITIDTGGTMHFYDPIKYGDISLDGCWTYKDVNNTTVKYVAWK